MSDPQNAQIRISVEPEPTDEELAAITAVVSMVLTTSSGGEATPASSLEDPWGRMGRREAMRGPVWPPDDDAW